MDRQWPSGAETWKLPLRSENAEDQITVWDTWREMTILQADNKMSETAQLKNLSKI